MKKLKALQERPMTTGLILRAALPGKALLRYFRACDLGCYFKVCLKPSRLPGKCAGLFHLDNNDVF